MKRYMSYPYYTTDAPEFINILQTQQQNRELVDWFCL